MKKIYFNKFIFIVIIILQIVFLINISFGESPEIESASGKSKDKSCKKLLGELQDTITHFEMCSLEHAVPVTFCTNCATKYFEVLDSYNLLISSNDTANNNHTLRCRDFYLDQDRLNIVNILYYNIVNLWNDAYCDDCYTNRTLKNQTKNFFIKNSNLTDCIEKEGSNISDICADCDFYYTDLNKYFNYDIKENDNAKVCFDVQDQMNRTRSYWSKTLKCCQRSVNLIGFGLVSSVFACIPILFYVGMYAYTKRQEANEYFSDNLSTTENNSGPTVGLAENNTNETADQSTSNAISSKSNNLTIDDDDDDAPLIFEPNLRSNISPIVIAESSRGKIFEKDDPVLNVANSYEDNNFLFDKKQSATKDIKIPAEIHTEPKLINLDQ